MKFLERTILPLFDQNSSKSEKINLVDDDKTTSSDEELHETFNQFFYKVVSNLNIPKPKTFPITSKNFDPYISVIKSSDKHPSIIKSKTKALDTTYYFRKTSCNEVEKIFSNLNTKMSSQQKLALSKITKLNQDLIL